MKKLIFALILLLPLQAYAENPVLIDAVEFCIHENGGRKPAPREREYFNQCVRSAYPEIIKFYQNYYANMGGIRKPYKETVNLKKEKPDEKIQ